MQLALLVCVGMIYIDHGIILYGNLHSCCALLNVMVPWHVVMRKAEYGHNGGNEVAKGTALSKRTRAKKM
jgi:hypothetical protein